MEILYRQIDNDRQPTSISFQDMKQCYFKSKTHPNHFSPVLHHHTGYEIHYLYEGCQQYEIENTICEMRSGEFLIISPYIKHRLIQNESCITKYSIFFSLHSYSRLNTYLKLKPTFFCGTISPQIFENINFIATEYKIHKEISELLIGNRVFETILLTFREAGLKEQKMEKSTINEDPRVALAKQYITDNIETALLLEDISKYCSLSPKQMTRLFKQFENMTLSSYITQQKIRHIEMLLADSNLTLSTICERMHFSSEYYFNTYFRKYAGMPPGQYRNMIHSTPESQIMKS